MCGITIFLSRENKNIIELIINSLENIQNRGYDSVGISFLDNRKDWQIKKYCSTDNNDSIDILKKNLINNTSNISIGHTRWATHGSRTENNAHPHISMNKRIIIVHNGIINNYIYLKKYLISKGYNFYSETDSEVIANLIEYNLKNNPNIHNAIKKSIKELEGTWALGIIDTNEKLNKIYITRHGSPLVLGKSEKFVICCSELSGFIGLINNYIILDNDDIISLTTDGYNTDQVYEINRTNSIIIENSPSPYLHWTIKEINEQPITINNATNNGARIKDDKIILGGLKFLNSNNIVVENIIGLGCGTSYHATMLLKFYFNKLLNNNKINLVQSFDASEFSELDIPKRGKTLCIICSQSGETRDLINAINICKNNDCITLGVVNVVDSMIAKIVDCGVYINAGIEKAVASTKSFTSMLIVLKLISLWFNENYGNNLKSLKIINNLRNLPNKVENLLNDKYIGNSCDNLINLIKTKNIENMFILGYGKMFAIAKEGALKIKEISYIHAEAYSAVSLKHGPFALLDKNTIAILLVDNENREKLLSTYNEIKSRDTNCFVITDIDCEDFENVIKLTTNYNNNNLNNNNLNNNNLNEIVFTICLQLIAYKLSISRNINPDKPRNLAKVVTVE